MKNKWIAILMAVFLGTFGVHRFYLRQTEIGLFFIGIYIWVKFINILGFPFSTLWGWYDAYRYLMMDQNEFDRKYNSRNFRDRYGNRRENAKNDTFKQGRYIILEQDQKDENESSGSIFEKYKKRKEIETFKQAGIKHFNNYDLKPAIESFENAILKEPNDISCHFYLACAYSLSENAKKSFEHLNQAIINGFKDWNKILTHESLAFIRVLPEFELFKQNQYKLTNEIIEKLDLRENRIFEELKLEREILLQKPKNAYGSYFQQIVNNEFK